MSPANPAAMETLFRKRENNSEKEKEGDNSEKEKEKDNSEKEKDGEGVDKGEGMGVRKSGRVEWEKERKRGEKNLTQVLAILISNIRSNTTHGSHHHHTELLLHNFLYSPSTIFVMCDCN